MSKLVDLIVEKSIKICKNEIFMREKVFANNPTKKSRKVAEMQFVIDTLEELKDRIDEYEVIIDKNMIIK